MEKLNLLIPVGFLIFNGNTINSTFMSNSAAPHQDARRTRSTGAGKRAPEAKMTKAQLYAQIGLVILIIAGISALAIFAT